MVGGGDGGRAMVDDNQGHRARLRERLIANAEALADYELLECLLALAIPRRDTKPLAKALLREFGGLWSLLKAPPAAIRRVHGAGDAAVSAIRLADAVAVRALKTRVAEQPVLSSWQALLDYLHADLGHVGVERVRVLHLNTKNMLIRDESMSEGSVDEAAVHVREVVRRALDLGSSSLILVHNHPSGDPQPSRQDIAITKEIIRAAAPFNIRVHDHVVIGSTGHASLRSMGLI